MTLMIRNGANVAARALQIAFKFLPSTSKELTFAGEEIIPFELFIPTRHGNVRCLVYRSDETLMRGARPPVYINFHGGAFIVRNPEQDEHVCRYIASTLRSVVVSVDYDTAPHVQYPVAEHQAYDIAVWVHHNGASQGWNGYRLAVGGFSAGAKLAINVCQQARDNRSFMPVALMAAYPALDMTIAPGDRIASASHPAVRPWLISLMYKSYFPYAKSRGASLASPLRDEVLSELPPTLLLIAGDDALAEEGERFSVKLEEAGVATTTRRFPRCDHGFTHNKPAIVVFEAMEKIAEHMERAFMLASPGPSI